MRHNPWLRLTMLIATAVIALSAVAQRNDKLLNRPYTDLRRWHLGFSVGVNVMSYGITNNGYITDDGQTWFTEQPEWSPGFCVNGLADLRLSRWFNLRFTPGMYFGNRILRMRDTSNDREEQQNVKSTVIVLPFDLKFSSERVHNARPYLIAGVMGTFDVSKRTRRDYLQFKSSGVMLTAGFGCDFYLPYFKFCPEIKFCFGLGDMLRHKRPDLADDPDRLKFTKSITKATQQMVVLSFYFE